MSRLDVDHKGFPILLADTPTGSTQSKVAEEEPSGPKDWQTGQWDRRADAVRDFAREFETYNAHDLRELLKGRTNRVLTDSEIMQFLADVREQQLNDVLDVLDQLERGKLRGRRFVRVVAPGGYLRKTLNALTAGEISRLEERLRARGWTDQQVEARLGAVKEKVNRPLPHEPSPSRVSGT